MYQCCWTNLCLHFWSNWPPTGHVILTHYPVDTCSKMDIWWKDYPFKTNNFV